MPRLFFDVQLNFIIIYISSKKSVSDFFTADSIFLSERKICVTIDEIKQKVEDKEYDFLRTNPHLQGKIIFLALGGSYAYGTNIETSDVDVRGCALNSRSDLLGLSSFEQVVDGQTDTTVYSFNKLVNLLINCNPNTIELLGCKPEHYFQMTAIGNEMIKNKKLFLSQRAANSFGGYATQQLRRLQNALARDRLPQEEVTKHLKSALERSIAAMDERFADFQNGGIKLTVPDGQNGNSDSEILCDIHIKDYPVRDLNVLLNSLTSVTRSYGELNHRNRKKDEAHLNKHAMHLIRLYLMCLDILEKEEINTYREKDREFLLSIRNGAFQNEDGTYKPDFFELVADLEKRLQYAKENTGLPKHPDMKLIEEFVMDVNQKSIDLLG